MDMAMYVLQYRNIELCPKLLLKNAKGISIKINIFKIPFQNQTLYHEIFFSEIAWRKFGIGQGREIPGSFARLHGEIF